MRQTQTTSETKPFNFEFGNLLHPATAFADPQDVVRDPDLTTNEKRAILASWASDACAVDSSPMLRRAPGSGTTVSIDEILDALRMLDRPAAGANAAWARRQIRRVLIEDLREKHNRKS
jgi:hypothetical protein